MLSSMKIFVFFASFILILLSANAQNEPLYKAKGDSVVLDPNFSGQPITSIVWNHGSDLVAEWYEDNITCLRQFEGRCSLDFNTGALTITGADESDNGLYSVEINNNKIDSKIQLSIFSKVSKPSISSQCNTDKTACNLTCDGDTTDTEPVSYKWFTGDNEIGSDKGYEITKDTKEESFTCMMLNPVSEQSSDRLSNPIIEGERNRMITIIIVSVVVTLALAVIIGLIVIFIRRWSHGDSYDLKEDGGMSEHGRVDENIELLPNGRADQNQVNAHGLQEVPVELNQIPAPAPAQDNVGELENMQMLPNGEVGKEQDDAHVVNEIEEGPAQTSEPAVAQNNVGESGSEAQRVTTEAQVSAQPQNGEEAPVMAGPSEQNPESSGLPGTSQENESTSRTCETPVEDPQTLPEPVTNKDAVENSAVSLNNREPTNHKLTEHELNNHESNNHEPTLIQEGANSGGDGDWS